MNRIRQILLLMVYVKFIFIVSCPLIQAAVVTNRKDDIEIAVASKAQDNGRTLVTCVISNLSPHTIATTNIQTPSSVFYFKLLDEFDKEIQQNPEWAKSFAQKSSERYKRPRSFRMDQVYPGGKIKFEFYLEDAYNQISLIGGNLVVSWESSFFDKVVIISDYVNSEGKQVKGSEEKYMFPEKWAISATLPIGEERVKQPDNIKSADSGDDEDVSETIKVAAPSRERSANNPRVDMGPERTDYWWWIVAVPIMVLLWFALRSGKRKSKSRTSRG